MFTSHVCKLTAEACEGGSMACVCVRTNALTDYIEPDGRGRLGDGDDSHRLSHGSCLWHREVVGPLGKQQWQGWWDRFANPLYMEFDSRPQRGITAVLGFYLSGGSNIEKSLRLLTRSKVDWSI